MAGTLASIVGGPWSDAGVAPVYSDRGGPDGMLGSMVGSVLGAWLQYLGEEKQNAIHSD